MNKSPKNNLMKNGITGIWIPIEICLNPNLSTFDQKLLGIIYTLSLTDQGKKRGGCFASNAYFAEIMMTTKGTIAKSLSILRTKGFIINNYAKDESGNSYRRIKIKHINIPFELGK